MALDTSFYGQIQPIKVGDPLERAGKFYTLQSAMQQSQAGQQRLEDDAALRQAASEAGGDPKRLRDVLMQRGQVSAALSIDKDIAVRDKEQRAAEQTDIARKAEKAKYWRDQLATVNESNYPQFIQAARSDGMQFAADAPAQFDPKWQQQHIMTADKFIERAMPKPAPPAQDPTFVRELKAAGLEPGTPEYDKAMKARIARETAPTTAMTAAAAGETPAGLSRQYAQDPEYKKNVDYWANFLKDGGTLPPRFAQSGAGKKMMPDILNVVPTLGGGGRDMLANQVELTGQKSQARAVGTRSAAVEMAAGEAREMMPVLQKTSEAFQRTGYQPINKVLKAWADRSGSVESRQFGAALNTFINVYARAVSPSGVPTVHDKDHAREILSTADSHEQLMGLLKVLDQEMTAAQHAPQRVRATQRESITGTQAPSSGGGALPPKNAKGWSLMQDAKGNKAYVGPNQEIEEVR